jgi:hypothetical protein
VFKVIRNNFNIKKLSGLWTLYSKNLLNLLLHRLCFLPYSAYEEGISEMSLDYPPD